jgi:membrane protease YdiL (CAAX protease family)
MIGIIALLALSWLLLWAAARKTPAVLGFRLEGRQGALLVGGFFFAAALCGVIQMGAAQFTGVRWEMNPNAGIELAVRSLWWNVKSVLTEEFVFRGALLYVAVRKLGAPVAITVSAVAFGIYHWFSAGALGNVPMMAIIFLATGLMGLVWAHAFVKTGCSMMLPIGLHLGWNFTYNSVLSLGPLGPQLLTPSVTGAPVEGWPSLVIYLVGAIVPPALTYVMVRILTRPATAPAATYPSS